MGVILLYHRIAVTARDPHRMYVSPERFAAHVGHLRRAWDVVPLSEVAGGERRVAITFDDGYADNAVVAAPLLAEAGLPVTFFLTAGMIGAEREFWWDRLDRLVHESEATAGWLDVTIAGRRLRADVRTTAGRARAYRALQHRLRPLPVAGIEAVLDELSSQLAVVDGAARPTHRLMTGDEVRSLLSRGAAEVGCHSMTHAQLATVPEGALAAEIAESRSALRKLTAQPVTAFAYPYGDATSVDGRSFRLVRRAGYRRACLVGGAGVGRWSPRLRLPRYWVENWDGDEFAERLAAASNWS